jgi:hypothetical protein
VIHILRIEMDQGWIPEFYQTPGHSTSSTYH